MRKVRLVVLVCLLASGLRAQELKIVVGAGFSTYSKMWAPEYRWDWSDSGGGLNPFKSARLGMAAGLGIEIPISSRVVLEADALYVSKGALFRQASYYQQDPLLAERVRKEFSLQGFSVPILARVRVWPRPYPYLVAGLDVSFCAAHMLHEYDQDDSIGPNFQAGPDIQLLHETRTLDWGPILGIGYDIVLPMAVLELDIRYQAGIPDINREPGGYRVHTRSFFIVAGFRI